MIKSRSKGARSLHRLHVRHPMKVSGNLIIRKQSYLGRTFQDGPVNLVHLRSHSPYWVGRWRKAEKSHMWRFTYMINRSTNQRGFLTRALVICFVGLSPSSVWHSSKKPKSNWILWLRVHPVPTPTHCFSCVILTWAAIRNIPSRSA